MSTARTILTLLLVVMLAGCESAQKKVIRLQAEYDKIDAQYKSECDDPWSSTDPQQAPRVLHGESQSPAEAAAFRAREKARANRIASPHCQEIDGRRKQASADLLAAQSKTAQN